MLYSIFDTDTSFSRNPATLRTTLAFVIATVSGGKYRTRYRFQRRRDVVVAALNKSTNYSLHSATIGSVLFSTRPTSGTYSEPVCGLSFTPRGNVFTDAYLDLPSIDSRYSSRIFLVKFHKATRSIRSVASNRFT